MPLVLLFHYLLLSMFRMLVHPSSGACEAPEDGCANIRNMLSSK